MQSDQSTTLQDTPAAAGLPQLAAIAALGIAILLAAVLGIRTISSPDIGYHLAYGEEFLDKGRIVDYNDFLYTLPKASLVDKQNLSPGSWYDEQGHYRFPNANWLSQVIMAAVHRWAGPTGLSVIQAAMVLTVFLLITAIMLKLGVPPLLAGAGILLAAMTAYDRFNLRPEMFGYTILAIQLYLLVVAKMRWGVAAALVVLQLLLVNLHSYFLLGLAITGAVFIERGVLALWNRPKSKKDAAAIEQRRHAKMLGIVLAAQMVVCFINPWTWRLVLLPIQTLLFMQKHSIAGDPGTATHPWSYIGEMYRPFAPAAFLEFKSTQAYRILLGVSALGFIFSLLKRRFAFALIIAGMTAVSLSMRRNIGVAAMIITPLALAASWQFLVPVIRQMKPRQRGIAVVTGSFVLAVVCGFFILSVVNQRFYYNEQSPYRFGTGFSRLNLPLGMTQWLSEHKPKGRIWADWDVSCSVHYFTSPQPDVPALTNIWAYPPCVMKEMMEFGYAERPFDEAVKKYSIEVVALRVGRGTNKLVDKLDKDKWALVYIDGIHVLFLRRTGANADLIDKYEITEASIDTTELIDRLKTMDPVPAHALYSGGLTLDRLGWRTTAVKVFEAAVEEDPASPKAWNMLGVCLAKRGIIKVCANDPGHRKDFIAARDAFRRALELDPGYKEAARHLQEAEQDIRNPSRYLPKQ